MSTSLRDGKANGTQCLDCVAVLSEEKHFEDYVLSAAREKDLGRKDREDPFYMVNIGQLLDLHKRWTKAMPSVRPFYAVKANPDPMLLRVLAALGTGFDCASKSEIEQVLSLGVSPERIIFANPIKFISHLQYAARNGVKMMTFDCENELYKIKKHSPDARLVVRISADDITADLHGEGKFGCSTTDACVLITTANKLDLNITGVCFHVGSGCQNPDAFQSALQSAAEVFQFAESVGYKLTLLDVGGGFLGTDLHSDLFQRIADSINKSVDHYFGTHPDLDVIAEPGQYFSTSIFTLVTTVVGKKEFHDGRQKSFAYYLSDRSLGQRFRYLRKNNNLDVISTTLPRVITQTDVGTHAPPNRPIKQYPTIFWGPTCAPIDLLHEQFDFQELMVGDWLYVPNAGAYNMVFSGDFNGFPMPVTQYYIRESRRDELEKILQQ